MESQNLVSPDKRGFGNIAFEVENVESVLEVLEKNSGRASEEIAKRKVNGIGEITFVYARDPEGNLIELQSRK